MVQHQYDQNDSTTVNNPYILFDIEPLRNFERHCIDDVIATMTHWLGRHYELMYLRAWNFAFLSAAEQPSKGLGERLRIEYGLDLQSLEHFHGLSCTVHEDSSAAAAIPLIEQKLAQGTPVVLTVNSFWIPWDENYQRQDVVHSFIIVGFNPLTRDLYCTDPYFKRQGILLPYDLFLRAYQRCTTFTVVKDEMTDFSTIAQALLQHLSSECAGNRPFVQMRALADALTTSFDGAVETAGFADFSEVPLFMNMADAAESRLKSAHLLSYLGTTYDPDFLPLAEQFKKISSQWGQVRGTLIKMHLTKRWSQTSLQKAGLRLLNASVEEQGLVQRLLTLLKSFQDGVKTEHIANDADEDWDDLDEDEAGEESYVAPASALETTLAQIWQTSLQEVRVGVSDNFFALGGHSLKALNILAQIYEQCQIRVPVSVLFAHPTIRELAQALSGAQAVHYQSIEPEAPQAYYPVSSSQERMYFQQQLAESLIHYNIPGALLIEGQVDFTQLEAALQVLIQRHEVLRTSFHFIDEKLVQRVHDKVPFEISYITASQLEIEQIIQDFLQPFDLSKVPLIRFRVVTLADKRILFLSDVHHIVADGVSLAQFNQEFLALYHGESLSLLRIQYKDFACWQRRLLQSDIMQQQESYWVNTLRDSIPLTLPTDFSATGLQNFAGARVHFSLSPELTRKLHHIADESKCTLYMVLLTAYALLLSRYSGQEDLCIGSPIAGKTHPDVENVLGMFGNMLALRVRINGEQTVRQMLDNVKQVVLGGLEHQDYPFDELVKKLAGSWNRRRNPLLDTVLNLQNMEWPELEIAGLKVTTVNFETGLSKFDFSCEVMEREHALEINLEYSTEVFLHATVERLGKHFHQLLQAITENTDTLVREIDILTREEKQHILYAWNDTYVDLPTPAIVPHRFETQVERSPDAVALVCEEHQLTYAFLNQQANQLASYLRELGVCAESPVGSYLKRSVDQIIGLLATLKAGGAYLPLDLAYPQERLHFMLEDTRATVVLTTSLLSTQLAYEGSQMVCLDQVHRQIEQQSTEDFTHEIDPENLAYVIYTSGSTGQPKGVGIAHQGIVRLVTDTRYVELSAAEIIPQFASISFDVATFEIWGSLLNGARLVLFPDQTPSLEEFGGLLQQHGVTTLWLTAGLFHLMVAERVEALSGVRQLLAGGDVLSVPHSRRLLETLENCKLINGYGPTENTVFTTCYTITEPDQIGASVPIGRPIANTQVYVLDADWACVPIGVAGELYIGGDGLARGYLKRPELTAERFLPHPFSTQPGARLYKTGDLVRYRADGILEFLGRNDQQVKLRGFRIEMGEIEAALQEHPAIREVAVIAREDHPGDKRLVAYYIVDAHQNELPSVGQLRSYLQARLPDYMLPAAYLPLEHLPLTANGKLDRRALPIPEQGLSSTRESFVAPQTPLQERLATIWTELLHVSPISIHDIFFELGGHSLLATQMLSRLHNTFQIDLSLRSIFEHPTIAQLEQLIEPLQRADSSPQRPALIVQPRPAILPLSFAQERLWFLDQFEPLSTRYNMLMPLRLDGPLSIEALEQSLKHIVQRHEVLRTTFALHDGHPIQIIAPMLTIPLPVFDLCGLSSEKRAAEIRHLIAREAARPFDLRRGPLLRVTMMRLGTQEHLLLFTQHHIVSDGWSIHVLVQELNTLYQAYHAGHAVNLPALPLQYADYALWQRQWLQGEALQRQLHYWRQQLAGAPALLNLPTDRPRPAAQTSAGANIARLLPVDLLRALHMVSQQEGVTLFMTLLAALGVLLSRYSGQDDIVVGSPIANRNQTEVEALIGFFVNTLALRLELSGAPSFHALLERVREVTLQAYMYQDVPFEKLVEDLKPERSLSYSPLFQVMFALQNMPEVALKMDAELSVQAVDFEQTSSTFDLSILMSETKQGLATVVTYNTELFDAATIVALLDHWQMLLQGIVADPQRSIAELPLLTREEYVTVLDRWNDTQSFWDDSISSIYDLIAAQVQATPERVALVCGEQQLTYQVLQQSSTGLAQYLKHLGVEAGHMIGLYLERNEMLPIALLAVLQLGASYVPMDPLYPRERLAFMLHDAQVRFVLTQQALEPQLVGLDCSLVCLDCEWEKISSLQSEQGETECLRLPAVDPAQIAYTIYTSGSTGTPKGVQITHRAVLNLLHAMQRQPGIDENDVLLALTTIAFDIAALELFTPLSVGARLVLADVSLSMNGPLLGQMLAQEAVTVVQATPTTWQMLVGQGWDGKLPLKILCGGEALPPRLAQLLLQRGVQLWNMYGPTETTIWSTCSHVTSEKEITLGYPIANTQLYLLDAHLNPVPIGVSGEVYLGGVGLAQGYWQRANLTAERFVPHPFSRELGARLYRTGDLARYSKTGSLEYLGRKDQQVKLRGFRIELGEIEAVLLQHPALQEAVVIIRGENDEYKTLLAYVVARAGAELGLSELREHLRQRLPAYMLPSHFFVLERLPLTPNGKVDRNALPDPEQTSRLQAETYVAPRTPVEEQLVSIWKKLLGVPQVGIYDNFFEHGGHSLLSVQLLDSINQCFSASFSLAMLFHFPTIAQVASILAQQDHASALPDTSLIVPLRAHGSRQPFFVVHPVSGDLYSYLHLVHYLPQDRSIYGIQAVGLLDGQEPVAGIEEMAGAYVDALLRVQPEGPYLLGGHSLGGLIALEMARRLQSQGQVVSLLVLMDSVFSPEAQTDAGAWDETQWLIEVVRTLEGYRGLPGLSPTDLYAELRNLEPDDQLRYLLERIKQAQIVPQETDLAAFRRLLGVIRANTQSQLHYHPREIYQGDLVFLTCEEKEYDPWALWSPFVAGSLEMQGVSGDHFSMLTEPHVRALAEHLQYYLDQY